MSARLLAIDPPGCGCTECLIGEYVPLELASKDDILLLLTGRIADHTDLPWRVTLAEDTLEIAAHYGTYRWTFDLDAVAGPLPFDEHGRCVNDSAYELSLRRG